MNKGGGERHLTGARAIFRPGPQGLALSPGSKAGRYRPGAKLRVVRLREIPSFYQREKYPCIYSSHFPKSCTYSL